MSNNFNTHTIKNFPSKKRSVLARNSDGMLIAYREGDAVHSGEDPRDMSTRAFMDHHHAQKFLRGLADRDQQRIMHEAGHSMVGVTARIEEIDGDRMIV